MKISKVPLRIDFAGGTTDIQPFPRKYGGAVLNAAINYYVNGWLKTNQGITLQYSCHAPTHSGLGTSTAMSLAWLSLILKKHNPRILADKVLEIEHDIGLTSGKQDQYTSVLGGINFLQFLDDKVKVTRLNLPQSTVSRLESNFLICYNKNLKRFVDLNRVVVKKLNQGNPIVINSLKNMKRIAFEMKKTLEKKQFAEFAELMNEEWHYRSKMFPTFASKEINLLVKKCLENGALGAKVLGSCNGGVVLAYCDNKTKLKQSLSRLKNIKYFDFKFDFKGLQVHTI